MRTTRARSRSAAGSRRATSAATSSPSPPRSDWKAEGGGAPGEGAGGFARRRPRIRLPCARSSSRKRGNVARIESRSGSPAWIPARSGSPSRSTASCPKRRRRNDAIDSSASPLRPGIASSKPMRSLPGQEKSPLAASGRIRVGTASIIPSGSGWSLRLWSTYTARRSGSVGTRRSPSPSSRQSAMPSGFWARIASGPASIRKPRSCSVRITPPKRSPASRSTYGTRRFWSAQAAARPEMPPPITATVVFVTREPS